MREDWSGRQSILAALMLILLDFSGGATAGEAHGEMAPEDGISEIADKQIPPLYCGDEVCELKDRAPYLPPHNVEWPVQEPGWWFAYWYDQDNNGMDDRLQWIISGERESVSTSAILGDDGRMTVAIFVDYAWHPGSDDIDRLKEVLAEHGWEEYGSYFRTVEIIDTVIIEHVPVSSLIDILMLEGVVLVEQQNVLVPYLNTAPRGSKVRDSDVYSETMRDYGYDGSGVVIAIADTGVDNEHFSLDDFSDNNDDNEAEPDELPDPKWVAGCDATSWNQQDCDDGGDDPDDGDGHGTHVAGIALGTGDSERENQGYAPGAYLVDIKVMTDAGASNSGYTVAGINWAVQNVNTDWGNNDSSRGIDILSMSFGSSSNPTGDDPGDNGTGADANAVNAASDAGIVCVAAIGNDGYRRVTSVGAADSAITVGATDDKASIERGDDSIASYSNSGPREDDGDDDEWDELKPDVVAPGSNIMSAQHAASSSQLPGSPKPLASDNYVQMSGTSMSTPAVAGFIAGMLQMDDGLSPQEIKDILRNNSETRGEPSEPGVSQRWNDQYGFGIVDGEMVLQAILGDDTGGGGGDNVTDPPPAGAGEWIVIETPEEDSWLVEGETYSVRGHIDEDADTNGTIEEVKVRITYTHRPDDSPKQTGTLLDWHTAQGTVNWSSPFSVPEFSEDEINIEEIIVEVQARNQFEQWSKIEKSEHSVGLVSIGLGGPSGQTPISGNTNVYGTWESVNGGTVQWRLGTDSWENIDQFGGSGSGSGDWSVNWNTEDVNDGFYRISVRIISGDGVHSEEVRRTVEVDNDPPAPDLIFRSGISVDEYGITISEAYVNTFLEVRCEVRNDGDLDASEVSVFLKENGARKDEIVIPSIGSGDIVEIVLYWNPSTVGEKLLTVSLDPSNNIEEINEDDNEQSLTFPILQRPQGIDLALREGAVRTEPAIPRPSEQFLVTARVDNLGSSDATNVEATLEIRNSLGWESISSTVISLVVGQGASQVSFAHWVNESGPIEVRVTLAGSTLADLDWSNNQIESYILVDETSLTGSRSASFSVGETPIEIIDMDEEGGIVITEKDGVLGLYRMNLNRALTACTNVFEEMWTGDIAIISSEDMFAHIAWTRRYLDASGYFRQTVSYTTLDSSCQMTPVQDIMPPLLLSDGKYWGLDMDVRESEIMIAGYHRDIFTSGTQQEITSVFILSSDAPTKGSDWSLNPSAVSELDLIAGMSDPVDIEFGDEDAHLLFQSLRNDTTGVDRLGLWYAHGLPEQTSWGYKKAVGDHAFSPEMAVYLDGDDEVIVAVWGEGDEASSELVAIIADSTFTSTEGNEMRVPARGLGTIELLEVTRGTQVFFDFIGPGGPQMQYGMINTDEGWIGISDRIGLGLLSVVDRSPVGAEAVILHTSQNGWQIRSLVDDASPGSGNSNFLEMIRISLGLDEQNFNVLLGGTAITVIFLSAIVLLTMSARAVRWINSRRKTAAPGVVMLEDDFVDVILESDISISSSEVELVEEEEVPQSEGASERKRRREVRARPDQPSHLPPMPIPSIPPPEIMPSEIISETPELPPPVQMNRSVLCHSCEGRFEVPGNLKMTKCPVCDERIDLW